MSTPKLVLLTTVAMLAFAGNSLLCRLALAGAHIDAASFTVLRLLSGAFVLFLIIWLRHNTFQFRGSWSSASALFIYAAGFSFAYLSLSTATGALLLFGAVQATMIAAALLQGERFSIIQLGGITLALLGLVVLLFPGIEAPPIFSALLMLLAGIAWGCYSLLGKKAQDPLLETAGHFALASAAALSLIPILLIARILLDWNLVSFEYSSLGLTYALASGALASGLGYALWYAVLPSMRASSAATVQLCVPVLAGLGGVLILNEALSMRLVLASFAILGGVTVFLRCQKN